MKKILIVLLLLITLIGCGRYKVMEVYQDDSTDKYVVAYSEDAGMSGNEYQISYQEFETMEGVESFLSLPHVIDNREYNQWKMP